MARRQEDIVADRPYDEAISIDDDDEEVSTPGSSEPASPAVGQKQQQLTQKSPRPAVGKASDRGGGDRDDDDEESDSEASDSEASSTSDSSGGGNNDDRKAKAGLPSTAYNPDDFKSLKVSKEVEELFQYITQYKPHTIELDAALKPFIPELIPSIGEVDAFLKMPRPDGQSSGLGTTCLDEPTMNPSDPSILDLQLRSLSKNQDLQPMEVRSIAHAEKCPKEIENWYKRIDDLNRSKPAPTVQYSRKMPDIEQLMQVWPAEFEEFLQQNPLPDFAELDLDLPSYIRILASILDVPVYNQMTETLHVLFTLYSEFKSNQHFSKAETANPDPYSFGPVPNFAQGTAAGVGPGTTGPTYGGPSTESIAPSRAPSPVGHA